MPGIKIKKRIMELKEQTKINELKTHYETAVSNSLEKWKTNFYLDYNNNPNKYECHNEYLSFFINVIFDKSFDGDKGFGWLKQEPIKRIHFYKHLMQVRKNSELNYNFLNRIIDGKNVDPNTDNIPEIFAGTAWRFYTWLEEFDIPQPINKLQELHKSENDNLPILIDSSNQRISGTEIAFYYHYNNNPICSKNIAQIAVKFSRTPRYLLNKNTAFLETHTDFAYIIDNKNRWAAAIKLLEKMLPFIHESNKKKPKDLLEKLKLASLTTEKA